MHILIIEKILIHVCLVFTDLVIIDFAIFRASIMSELQVWYNVSMNIYNCTIIELQILICNTAVNIADKIADKIGCVNAHN